MDSNDVPAMALRASRPDAEQLITDHLARADADPNLRYFVARNPLLTEEQRQRLLQDSDDLVRIAARKGPNTGIHTAAPIPLRSPTRRIVAPSMTICSLQRQKRVRHWSDADSAWPAGRFAAGSGHGGGYCCKVACAGFF
jgi:hypothetical protein